MLAVGGRPNRLGRQGERWTTPNGNLWPRVQRNRGQDREFGPHVRRRSLEGGCG